MAPTEDEIEKLHPKRVANRDKKFVAVGDKRLKQLQRAAWEAGWWPEDKKKGLMWQSPDGRFQVMLHKTNSDRRAYDNARADFKAAGLNI